MADIKFSQFTAGGNVKVGDTVVGLRDADNAKFTFPGTGIEDADGNFILGYSSSGAGNINYVFIENATTMSAPEISAIGADTDIDLQLSSKGTGSILINDVNVDSLGNISEVSTSVFKGSSSGNATLKAQAVAGTPVLELPTTSGTLALTSAIPALPLSMSQGGTGASLSPSDGGIFYSTSTTGAILNGTATAGQIIRSGSSSAPSWSTATYPSSTTANRVLYSSSNDVIGEISDSASGVLVSNASGVPSWSGALGDGDIIIGSNGGVPQAAALSQGPGITITPAPGSITISSNTTGGGLVWTVISGTSQLAAVNNGYIPSDVGLTTITLPDVCNPGDMISVQGEGSGGWLIQANISTGQVIHIGSSASYSGGSVASANRYDSITLVCIVANTEWAMYGPVSSGFVIN